MNNKEYRTVIYKIGHIVPNDKSELIKKTYPSYPLVEEPDGWFRWIRQEDVDRIK